MLIGTDPQCHTVSYSIRTGEKLATLGPPFFRLGFAVCLQHGPASSSPELEPSFLYNGLSSLVPAGV